MKGNSPLVTTPKPPSSLNEYALDLLNRLKRDPLASEFVIGGGVALSHYVDYRKTNDLDVWWKTKESRAALDAVEKAMKAMAADRNLTFSMLKTGEVDRLILHEGKKKVFSFEIAPRDRSIGNNHQSAWKPLMIESFEDNLASKMTALVSRGAPRDFLDIHTVCGRGISPEKCWELYAHKHGCDQTDVAHAKSKVGRHLRDLERRRPLGKITDLKEREKAGRVRSFFKTFAGKKNGNDVEMGR